MCYTRQTVKKGSFTKSQKKEGLKMNDLIMRTKKQIEKLRKAVSVESKYGVGVDDKYSDFVVYIIVSLRNYLTTIQSYQNMLRSLKALVDAGITEINGFEYTIKDTKKLEDEANQKAINDAKNKASVLAKGFGVKIKKACSLKFTNSNNVSSYRLQSRMAKVATLAVANDENDSNTEYSPEKITISSDVYASFAIKD